MRILDRVRQHETSPDEYSAAKHESVIYDCVGSRREWNFRGFIVLQDVRRGISIILPPTREGRHLTSHFLEN